MGHMTLLVQHCIRYTGERICIGVPSSRICETREDDEGVHPMKTEPESPQPTRPAREGRTQGTLVALINLLLSVALLLSLGAAWVFIPIANAPAVCVFHHKPWWISLVDGSAFLLIPASIVVGIVAVKSSKKEDRGLLHRLGILNFILGVLLILPLGWAEFLYFVCQL